MNAVLFGGHARNEREGGICSEPGVRCFECGSRWALNVVAPGVYHCAFECDVSVLGPAKPSRTTRTQVWAQ